MARQASLFCDRSGDALLFDIWFIPDSFIRALDSLDWAAVGLSNGAATRLRKRLRSMHYLSKRTWYIFIQEFRFFSKCPFFLVTVTSPSQTEWNPSPINMWEKKTKGNSKQQKKNGSQKRCWIVPSDFFLTTRFSVMKRSTEYSQGLLDHWRRKW